MAGVRVAIDTDPGVDDAVAILLALASPELDVVGVTTVAGNVGLDLTTLNARRLLDLAGRADVPIAAGCAQSLRGAVTHEGSVHGEDGLGDLAWPEPRVGVTGEHAVDLLWSLATAGPLSIVSIGPMTNLATLLDRYPEADTVVERVVVMGGASFEGNVSPAAEFNVWADPEAAARVLGARWPVTVMPLDLTHQATLGPEEVAAIRGLGTEVGTRVAAMLERYADFHDGWYGHRRVIMHDATAVYELIDPGAIESQGAAVTVETGGEHSRGATFFDRRRVHADSRVRVGVRLDPERFSRLLLERLATYR